MMVYKKMLSSGLTMYGGYEDTSLGTAICSGDALKDGRAPALCKRCQRYIDAHSEKTSPFAPWTVGKVVGRKCSEFLQSKVL